MPASRPSGSASSVSASPPGRVILSATLALSSGRYSASRTRRRARRPATVESALGRTDTSTRPGTSPTSQRTVCRHDRSRSLSVGSVAVHSPAPEVADHEGATWPLPNCWATRAGAVFAPVVADLGKNDGPRLDPADPVEGVEAGHRGQPLPSSSSVLRVRTQGCSQPSRVAPGDSRGSPGAGPPAGSDKRARARRRACDRTCRRRTSRGRRASETTATLAHEIPQRRELVRREEAGLQVVEDDRMIAIELVGRLGEAVAQLDLVERSRAGPAPADRPARPCRRRDGRTRRRGGWPCGRGHPGSRTSAGAGRSGPGRRAGPDRPRSRARRRNLNSQFGRPLT